MTNRFQNAGPKPESAATDKGVLAVTTPTAYARAKRQLWTTRLELRMAIARIRHLRASGRLIDSEDAQGDADLFFAVSWPSYRREQEWLRTHRPVKYSHLSPRAALARCNGGAA